MSESREKSGSLSLDLDHEHEFVLRLAVAVIKRALADLHCHEIHARAIRRDAYDFLINRLWEPDSLWGEIISPYLERRTMCEEVNSKVRILANGDVILR